MPDGILFSCMIIQFYLILKATASDTASALSDAFSLQEISAFFPHAPQQLFLRLLPYYTKRASFFNRILYREGDASRQHYSSTFTKASLFLHGLHSFSSAGLPVRIKSVQYRIMSRLSFLSCSSNGLQHRSNVPNIYHSSAQ